MIRTFREDTQWAIGGNVSMVALEWLAGQLPKELQGDGSKIVVAHDSRLCILTRFVSLSSSPSGASAGR